MDFSYLMFIYIKVLYELCGDESRQQTLCGRDFGNLFGRSGTVLDYENHGSQALIFVTGSGDR
ncbi:hypothetical protein [Chamaesiphon sp.]|uniref:hypothetical protein n=1 Tax=Chamaesiphon sp. TaxID=2814140 RepID=UPI0035938225